MGALIWRELVAITRTPAYWVSAVLYITALTGFVVVWGDGIPVVGARSSWEQFTMFQRVLLAIVFPWTAARCGTSSRRELTLIGFLSARSPSSVLLAQSAALAVSLLALALSSLPVMALMQQIAASPAAVALDMAPVAVLALLVAIVTITLTIAIEAPIRVWGVAGTLTLVAAVVGPPRPGTAPFVLAAVVVAVWLCLSALRSRLVYLPKVRE